jgi:hypothetical protein
MAGGAVPDPVMALARVLSSLVDANGDVAIDGVWDDVRPLAASEREPIKGFDDDTGAFARVMGLRPGVELTGDPTVPLHARLWLRPALTVIGIDGHPIKGSSNQIVARATARVSLRLAPGQDPADAAAVETLRIKSMITYPRTGNITPGNIPVRGFAWAGAARVWMVETSVDDGMSWYPANMFKSESPYEWCRWNTSVVLQNVGPATIMVRATDGKSARQPMQPSLNAGGYGYNAIHAVTVNVVP